MIDFHSTNNDKKLTKINNWNKQGATANQQEKKTGKTSFKKNRIH